MAFPKRSPRERFQLKIPSNVAWDFRRFASARGLELSEVASDAIVAYLLAEREKEARERRRKEDLPHYGHE